MCHDMGVVGGVMVIMIDHCTNITLSLSVL